MNEYFARTEMLLKEDAMRALSSSHVAIFGVGGVGGYVLEGLVRCGVGEFTLVDSDIVSPSNINRQIIATTKTIGMPKVEAAAKRAKEIFPMVNVHPINRFFLPENAEEFDFSSFDYVVDCIDTVSSKIALVLSAQKVKTPIISAMGAGNKLDPARFEISDIYKTSVCPLARVMRIELRRRGVKKLKVVYSKEPPMKVSASAEGEDSAHGRRSTPGSISFVPAAAGLVIAGEVIRDLIASKNK